MSGLVYDILKKNLNVAQFKTKLENSYKAEVLIKSFRVKVKNSKGVFFKTHPIFQKMQKLGLTKILINKSFYAIDILKKIVWVGDKGLFVDLNNIPDPYLLSGIREALALAKDNIKIDEIVAAVNLIEEKIKALIIFFQNEKTTTLEQIFKFGWTKISVNGMNYSITNLSIDNLKNFDFNKPKKDKTKIGKISDIDNEDVKKEIIQLIENNISVKTIKTIINAENFLVEFKKNTENKKIILAKIQILNPNKITINKRDYDILILEAFNFTKIKHFWDIKNIKIKTLIWNLGENNIKLDQVKTTLQKIEKVRMNILMQGLTEKTGFLMRLKKLKIDKLIINKRSYFFKALLKETSKKVTDFNKLSAFAQQEFQKLYALVNVQDQTKLIDNVINKIEKSQN